MIKSLPKPLRTNFVPAPDHARRALTEIESLRLDPSTCSFNSAMARALTRLAAPVGAVDFDPDRIPDRLRIRFRVLDPDGTEVAVGEDLVALQRQLGTTAGESLTAELSDTAESLVTGQNTWTFEPIPTEVSKGRRTVSRIGRRGPDGRTADPRRPVPGRDRASTSDRAPAGADHARPDQLGDLQAVEHRQADPGRIAVSFAVGPDRRRPSPRRVELARRDGDPAGVRDRAAFDRLRERVRADAAPETARIVTVAADTVRAHAQVQQAMSRLPASDEALADVAEQVENLIFDGFVAATEEPQLSQLPRYLRAAALRLDSLPGSATRDQRGSTRSGRWRMPTPNSSPPSPTAHCGRR